MIKSRNKYRKKWWVKPIRFMNYVAFRYWWFVWTFFIVSILLIFFLCCYNAKNTSKYTNCSGKVAYFNNMREIDSLMNNCCSCLPDTTRVREKEEILQDTSLNNSDEPNVDPPPLPPPPPNSTPCNSEISANGNNQDHHKTWDLGTKSGMVRYCYDTENEPDQIKIIYDGREIHDSGIIGTNGERCYSFNYRYDPSKPRFIDVYVFPSDNPETEWNYYIDCPSL